MEIFSSFPSKAPAPLAIESSQFNEFTENYSSYLDDGCCFIDFSNSCVPLLPFSYLEEKNGREKKITCILFSNDEKRWTVNDNEINTFCRYGSASERLGSRPRSILTYECLDNGLCFYVNSFPETIYLPT